MSVRKNAIVTALFLFLGTCVLYSQHMAFAQSKNLNLASLLGKDFPAYEKVLGAPKLIEKGNLKDESKDPAEKRYYKYPGVVRIVLHKGNDGVRNPHHRSPEQMEQLLKRLPKGARLLGGPQPM